MSKIIAILPFLAGVVRAQDLSKPALTPNLDYLKPGNTENLLPAQFYWEQWSSGWIPADCKSIAEDQTLNPSDFEVYNVYYADCGDPWIFCRHKDSPEDIGTTIETFGQLPVRMRSWVRHVLTIPGVDWAFNSNGNIAFSGETSSNVDVALHETGHSLDLLGAYGETLSSSQVWLDSYDQDSNVPDDYARTNQVENVAQNTVVAVYDSVNPGGFPGIQENWANIFYQYFTVELLAGDTILPGGSCDRHLENSEIVSLSSSTNSTASDSMRFRRLRSRLYQPDVSFKGTYNNIVKDFTPFNTKDHCKLPSA